MYKNMTYSALACGMQTADTSGDAIAKQQTKEMWKALKPNL